MYGALTSNYALACPYGEEARVPLVAASGAFVNLMTNRLDEAGAALSKLYSSRL